MSSLRPNPPGLVTDIALLESLYGSPAAPSLAKVSPHLTRAYRAWVEASPFFALGTVGPGGLDVSPRGDAGRAVTVLDERTLLIPDRRGNNRIDSLRNILTDPRVAVLFMIPGVNECLRINGRAAISVDPDLCQRLAMEGQQPRSVLWLEIDEVYFQCARALIRSDFWALGARGRPPGIPTAGQMTAEASDGREGGAAYDAALPERQRRTLW
ncbi:pyridoxamine 5'-phosphate oxidase family protein [Niveispirillum sp.]|uniref:pyridoxamine 5'-phosphate oxidase family protein n=1 Tax=Niveispirillum sp. TaxID=1917217 RepID=UPI001B61E84D|nr:pyridoxamine 5'-phosphate oxidase family protein [Niveispirillum sp.]MBP7337744.1 pyridoxamine 5'-phosphate oxidase family protein [Niveispirillum sp.]